ncbi:MAG: lipopolysaccharide biosynthesis protein [Thermoanaerobaculia bacterium]
MSEPSDSRRSLATLFVATMAVRGGAALGGLAWSFVIARFAGPERVGDFFLAFALILGCAAVARFGSDLGLMRFAGRDEHRHTRSMLLRAALSAAFLLSALLASLVFLLREPLAIAFGSSRIAPILSPMSWSLLAFAPTLVFMSFLKAVRRPTTAMLFETGGVMALSAGVLVVLTQIVGWGASSFVVGVSFALACALSLLAAAVITREWLLIPPIGSREVVREYETTRHIYMGTELVGYIDPIGGTLIAGLFLSASELGLWKVAEKIATLLYFAMIVVNSITGPMIATEFFRANQAGVRTIIRRATRYAVIVALPIFVVLSIAPGRVLAIFGDEFVVAVPILRVLAVAQFIRVVCGPVVVLLNVTNQARAVRNVALFWNVLGLLLYVAAVPKLGAVGAAYAAAAAMIGQHIVIAYAVWRSFGIQPLQAIFARKW